MDKLQSIVIVKVSKGYVAHLRFENRLDDADIASASKYILYQRIEQYVALKDKA